MDKPTSVTPNHTVLLLGSTGRTGGRVLSQCVQRGVGVRAIVRSLERLPQDTADEPLVTAVEADPLSITTAQWQRHLQGCDGVISCLGHTPTAGGIFGPPFDVVTGVVSKVADAVTAVRPAKPMRIILMSSVSVNRPAKADTRRGTSERLLVSAMRLLLPPSRDNQRAADLLAHKLGPNNPFVRLVVVRPDTLREGDVTPYALHAGLVSSLARSDSTNMANAAHFMCELVTDPKAWDVW